MRTIYRFYLYWKYFFQFLFENHPKLLKRTKDSLVCGVSLSIPFVIANYRPWPYWHDAYFICITIMGFGLVLSGVTYFLFHVAKALIHDIKYALDTARRKKFDPKKYYVCYDKYDVPLPEPQDISIARIQLGTPFRMFIPPGAVERMTLSLSAVGLLTPIKVRPLTPEEKAKDSEHDHLLICGQIRLRGAIQLGWEKIKAYVLELDLEQSISEAAIDNRHPIKDWVTEYEGVWDQLAEHPTVTMEMFAQLTSRKLGEIRLFLGVLDLLTPKARKMIRESVLSCEEEYIELHREPIDEYKAQFLAGLTGLCHDICLTRELVERTVRYALKWEMGGEEIEEMVGWVKDGFYPEDFGKEEGPQLRSWKERDTQEPQWPEYLTKHGPAEAGQVERMETKQDQGMKTVRVSQENIRTNPYDPRVIQEGGLKSFAKFIHKCLSQKGLGTSQKNNYEWGVRAMMAWFDMKQPNAFPLFEPGPGRIEEPVYVFYISKVGNRPIQWLVAAEVDDILRGCHLQYDPIWAKEYCKCIQVGLLDRLAQKNGSPLEGLWAGGACGGDAVYTVYPQVKV